MLFALPRVVDRLRIASSQLRASIPEASLTGTVTDQSSILWFIQDKLGLGQVGDRSFDAAAGTLSNLFKFDGYDLHKTSGLTLNLDPATSHANDQHSTCDYGAA